MNTNIISPVELYNDAVPVMNELIDKGYKLDTYHSKNEGYGFYIDLSNDYYVQVHMFSLLYEGEYIISLYKNNSQIRHDMFNRKEIKTIRNISSAEKLLDPILEVLDYAKTLSKTYKIDDLTQEEYDYLKILSRLDDKIKAILDKAK